MADLSQCPKDGCYMVDIPLGGPHGSMIKAGRCPCSKVKDHGVNLFQIVQILIVALERHVGGIEQIFGPGVQVVENPFKFLQVVDSTHMPFMSMYPSPL